MTLRNAPGNAAGASSATSDGKDDLTSLPMSELEKRLGTSGDGLSEPEASKRLAPELLT